MLRGMTRWSSCEPILKASSRTGLGFLAALLPPCIFPLGEATCDSSSGLVCTLGVSCRDAGMCYFPRSAIAPFPWGAAPHGANIV